MQTFDYYKEALENHIQSIAYENCPEILKSAMKYTLELPGKRLRGVLLLASYHMLAEDYKKALNFAVAIEMIHAYSLIHDDLPCMDNDDIRRGRPSNHKVYGEAMALLAGDGLLNYSYELMLQESIKENTTNAMYAMHCVAKRAGISGMIAGQVQDMTTSFTNRDADRLQYIHEHKTSDLIIASILAGLYLAGASTKQILAGEKFGKHLGMAFQIIDDILDTSSETSLLGKSIGKDVAQNKLTWISLYGIEQAKRDAEFHTQNAIKSIRSAFENPSFLIQLANDFLIRIK